MERRLITNSDAETITEIAVSVLKVSSVLLTFLAAGPVAALGAAFVGDATGILLQKKKERIAQFMQNIGDGLSRLPENLQDRFRTNVQTEDGEQILETAWEYAASSVDPEKVTYIANLVKNGLSSEELQGHHTRWLLRILKEVDSIQIIVLQTYSSKYTHPQRYFYPPHDYKKVQADCEIYREKHAEIFRDNTMPKHQRPLYKNHGKDPKDEAERIQWAQDWEDHQKEVEQANTAHEIAREKNALYQSRVHHLAAMGLIGDSSERPFPKPEDRVVTTLTPLGAALLKIIDVADHKEWGEGSQLNAVQALQKSRDSLVEAFNESNSKWGIR